MKRGDIFKKRLYNRLIRKVQQHNYQSPGQDDVNAVSTPVCLLDATTTSEPSSFLCCLGNGKTGFLIYT